MSVAWGVGEFPTGCYSLSKDQIHFSFSVSYQFCFCLYHGFKGSRLQFGIYTNKNLFQYRKWKGPIRQDCPFHCCVHLATCFNCSHLAKSPGWVKYTIRYNRKAAQVIFSRQLFVPTGFVGGRFDLDPQILDT